MALIEKGFMALRAPDGSFSPSVPLYEEIPDVLVTYTPVPRFEGDDVGEPFICEFEDSVAYLFSEKLPLIHSHKVKEGKKKSKRKGSDS